MRSSDPSVDSLRRCIGECLACGYSLQGLGPNSACPECGRPFGEDEFQIKGFSGVMLFSGSGCALILGGFAFVIGLMAALEREFGAALFACAVVIALVLSVYVRAQRSHGGLAYTPHLLVLKNELRLRTGGVDSLAIGWRDIHRVTLYRVFAGNWELAFTVGSLAFKPRFSFRADEPDARALLEFLTSRLQPADAP